MSLFIKGNPNPQFPHLGKRPYRMCHINISDKHRQIIFIPFGRTTVGFNAELPQIVTAAWPINFGELQTRIGETLDLYSTLVTYNEKHWPSYEASKAKSQTSYETDYISVRLETDYNRPYGDGEAERIYITARPTKLDSYIISAITHNIDTNVAQLVLDIYEACLKIRS